MQLVVKYTHHIIKVAFLNTSAAVIYGKHGCNIFSAAHPDELTLPSVAQACSPSVLLHLDKTAVFAPVASVRHVSVLIFKAGIWLGRDENGLQANIRAYLPPTIVHNSFVLGHTDVSLHFLPTCIIYVPCGIASAFQKQRVHIRATAFLWQS